MSETKIVSDRISTTIEFDFKEIGLNDGTVSLPSLAFTSDQSSGLYRIGASDLGISTGGVLALEISSSAISPSYHMLSPNGTAAAPTYSFSAETGLGWYRGGSSRMSLAFGTVEAAFFDGTTGVFSLKNNYNMQTNVGTATAPGYSFNGNSNTGIYNPAANAIGIVTNGAERWRFAAGGDFVPIDSTRTIFINDGAAATPSVAFNLDTDTGIYHVASNDLGLAAGGSLVLEIASTKAIFSQPVLIPDGTVSVPSLAFGSNQNTGFYHTGTNNFGITTGGVQLADISPSSFGLVIGGGSGTALTQLALKFGSGTAYNHNIKTHHSTTANLNRVEFWSATNVATETHVFDYNGGGQVLFSDGTASLPGVTFLSNSGAGMWSLGGSLRFSANGSHGLTLAQSGAIVQLLAITDGTSSLPAYSFGNQSSSGIYRPASNAIGFVLGSSAAEWRMTSTGLRPPAIDGGTTYGGFGESRSLNLGTTTDITPDIDASGFIQVRTFNNVNTASSSALYYWFSSATDAQITTIVAPTGSGGPAINSVTIVAPRTIRFNIGAFSGGSAFAFFVKLHNG